MNLYAGKVNNLPASFQKGGTAVRINRLRELMRLEGINALWVRKEENRRYLSGFTGDSGQLLITMERSILLVDGRFVEQAVTETASFEIVDVGNDPWGMLGIVLARADVDVLHFEAEHFSYHTYEEFLKRSGGWTKTVMLQPASSPVEKLRLRKEAGEIELIHKAAEIADAGFNHILKYLRPGIKERDIALELEYFLGKIGSDGPSFTTIIASGPRSALPHGSASGRVLKSGDIIVMDFGATYGGYCSDLTRTVALAPQEPFWQKIHGTVMEAQGIAVAAIKPGIEARELDSLAREHIKQAGYGDYFVHGLGHGVGLAVHEGPTISGLSDTVLETGMVFSIEPGIYLPGKGGIRIEDLILVGEEGGLALSGAPKEFFVL